MTMEAERSDAATSDRTPGVTGSWKGQGMNSPLEFVERLQLYQHLDLGLLASQN